MASKKGTYIIVHQLMVQESLVFYEASQRIKGVAIHALVWSPFVLSESAKKSKLEPSMRDEKILEDRNI
jgi:hypothetical protein